MRIIAGAVVTLVMSSQMTPLAQAPTPTERPATQSERPTTQGQSATARPDQVTVMGCVVREADYRRAQDAGKGGVAGTGVGSGNEFILTNVSEKASSDTPVATAGASTAYELTGSNEGQAQQFVGKRVEITGTLKRAEVSAAGPTGGPTAGKPPSGVDATSKDLKLRELEVSSVRAATTGTCPAPVKE